ncbi:MAG: LapA family protein [Rhodobacteraceae bacterium]|nr:LapA family protein [Paracoccaceae bacterium]
MTAGMLRLLRYLLLGLGGLVLLAVASANRGMVTLRLIPAEMDGYIGLGWTVDLPLFLVIFAGILAGLAIGLLWEWIRAAGLRAQARPPRHRVGHLEREVSRLRGDQGEKPDELLALLDGKGR